MKLPPIKTSIETIHAKQDAVDTVDGLIKRNMELEEINEVLQPLLYALSVKLYGEDNKAPVSLNKLIEDGVTLITGETV